MKPKLHSKSLDRERFRLFFCLNVHSRLKRAAKSILRKEGESDDKLQSYCLD